MTEQPLCPPWLRRGQTIGLFCPAGPVRDPERLQAGMQKIHDLGFATKICGPTLPHDGYLAADDTLRASSLHTLWNDEEVKAILAIRGGFGCMRILSQLDWELFGRSPKWLVGFSDVTVLLQGLLKKANLVSLHGAVATSLMQSDEASIHSLFAFLTGSFETRVKVQGLEILRGGIGQGRLVGGNLTTLVHLLATPYELDWTEHILFIEDTNEPLYRLDRLLTQLALSGKLKQLGGLILGEFDQGEDSLNNLRLQEAVWQRVMELAGPNFPVWAGFPLGHRQRNIALPVGLEAVMDSSAGILELNPSSVTTV
ncbi:LD-carboxypeptidase [Desulfobulbus rhabdoformis]|uniref:S66 peptidase family protein n=1 Tax=Desulfobulbus rhabdoformis TaxID=34032 RepID=UPI001962FEE9|nr:LD-carboxypeptidase [Desulfobulbus rhabdoformis]MBM9614936.1 LD-carboxypeptidase [Desulfobulbus rhabdoformis]